MFHFSCWRTLSLRSYTSVFLCLICGVFGLITITTSNGLSARKDLRRSNINNSSVPFINGSENRNHGIPSILRYAPMKHLHSRKGSSVGRHPNSLSFNKRSMKNLNFKNYSATEMYVSSRRDSVKLGNQSMSKRSSVIIKHSKTAAFGDPLKKLLISKSSLNITKKPLLSKKRAVFTSDPGSGTGTNASWRHWSSKTTSDISEVSAVIPNNKVHWTSKSGKMLGDHLFQPRILPSVSCVSRDIELIMCVPVKRDGFRHREAIRSTWGSYGRDGGRGRVNTTSSKRKTGEIILIFFIGSLSMMSAKGEQDSIEKEAKMYGDIYQADFIDTYDNLTLKSISMLYFVSSHCSNARYVAKIDDDMYVNIPLLMTTLRNHTKSLAARFAPATKIKKEVNTDANIVGPANHTMTLTKEISGAKMIINSSNPLQRKRLQHRSALLSVININDVPPFAFGLKFERATVDRDKTSKWFTPENVYRAEYYPDYLSGTAYSMSGSAALKLYRAALKVPFFWMEDVYITGLCARKAKIRLIGDMKLFSYAKVEPTGCAFKKRISGHAYKIHELQTIHTQLSDPTLKCE